MTNAELSDAGQYDAEAQSVLPGAEMLTLPEEGLLIPSLQFPQFTEASFTVVQGKRVPTPAALDGIRRALHMVVYDGNRNLPRSHSAPALAPAAVRAEIGEAKAMAEDRVRRTMDPEGWVEDFLATAIRRGHENWRRSNRRPRRSNEATILRLLRDELGILPPEDSSEVELSSTLTTLLEGKPESSEGQAHHTHNGLSIDSPAEVQADRLSLLGSEDCVICQLEQTAPETEPIIRWDKVSEAILEEDPEFAATLASALQESAYLSAEGLLSDKDLLDPNDLTRLIKLLISARDIVRGEPMALDRPGGSQGSWHTQLRVLAARFLREEELDLIWNSQNSDPQLVATQVIIATINSTMEAAEKEANIKANAEKLEKLAELEELSESEFLEALDILLEAPETEEQCSGDSCLAHSLLGAKGLCGPQALLYFLTKLKSEETDEAEEKSLEALTGEIHTLIDRLYGAKPALNLADHERLIKLLVKSRVVSGRETAASADQSLSGTGTSQARATTATESEGIEELLKVQLYEGIEACGNPACGHSSLTEPLSDTAINDVDSNSRALQHHPDCFTDTLWRALSSWRRMTQKVTKAIKTWEDDDVLRFLAGDNRFAHKPESNQP